MHLPEDFEVITLRPGEPVTTDERFCMQLIPRKLYVLPEGAKNNTPSFCWLLEDYKGGVYLAQITNDMLTEGLRRGKKT